MTFTSERPAFAAEPDDDTYKADDDSKRYARKSRGSGHTFDVKPYRHPQTIAPQRERYKDQDQYAYRGDRESESYETYDEDHSAPPPPRGSLKDDVAPDHVVPRRDHLSDRFSRHDRGHFRDRWADRRPERWRRGARCLPKRRIRRQLRRAGWRGFRHGRVRGNIGYVVARQRRTGEIFELVVDRCTGEVISASCIGRANRGFRRDRFRNRGYREDVVIRW